MAADAPEKDSPDHTGELSTGHGTVAPKDAPGGAGELQAEMEALAAVLFVHPYEAGGFEDLLEERSYFEGHSFRVCRGRLQNFPVVCCYDPRGKLRAAEATLAILRAYRPQWVVMGGFAGALRGELSPGQVAIVSGVYDPSLEVPEVPAPEIPPEFVEFFSASGLPLVRLASLFTPPASVEEKADLARRANAPLYDCSAPILAEFCRNAPPRAVLVRMVVEGANEVASEEARWIDSQRTWAGRAGAIIGSIFRRSGGFKATWRLFESRLIGSDQLGKFMIKLINELAKMPGVRWSPNTEESYL